MYTDPNSKPIFPHKTKCLVLSHFLTLYFVYNRIEDYINPQFVNFNGWMRIYVQYTFCALSCTNGNIMEEAVGTGKGVKDKDVNEK